MKAFIDMDGVLADFLAGVSKVHNRPLPYDKVESMGVWNIEDLWGISAREFWAPCEGEDFWNTLQKTDEADKIVELAYNTFGEENVAILTAPSSSIYCVPGKQAWVKRHYPELAKKIIFGSAKQFMAGPERVLVDDRDRNIEEFEKAGGHGIKVPRAWNSEWKYRHLTWELVKERMEKYASKER